MTAYGIENKEMKFCPKALENAVHVPFRSGWWAAQPRVYVKQSGRGRRTTGLGLLCSYTKPPQLVCYIDVVMVVSLSERSMAPHQLAEASMATSAHGAQQHSFNPYTENGGSIMAIAGKDFCVIAGDTRQSEGYSIQTRYKPKVFRL